MKSDLNIYVGQCDPYFMVQRLLLISRSPWRNVIPWILIPCDMKIDLKIYVGQCDIFSWSSDYAL